MSEASRVLRSSRMLVASGAEFGGRVRKAAANSVRSASWASVVSLVAAVRRRSQVVAKVWMGEEAGARVTDGGVALCFSIFLSMGRLRGV